MENEEKEGKNKQGSRCRQLNTFAKHAIQLSSVLLVTPGKCSLSLKRV